MCELSEDRLVIGDSDGRISRSSALTVCPDFQTHPPGTCDHEEVRRSLLHSKSFPTAAILELSLIFKNYKPLLPAPLLEVPRTAPNRCHRHRQRAYHHRAVSLEANCRLRSLNSLDSGLRIARTRRKSARCPEHSSSSGLPALARLHALVMSLAAIAVKERLAALQLNGAPVTATSIRAD